MLQPWLMQFEAFADVQKFSPALEENENMLAMASEKINETTEIGKLQAEAKKQNQLAMSSLTMAMSKLSLLTFIRGTRSKEWPKGKACLVMKALKERFQPDDQIALVEARQALCQVCMNPKEDTSTLFDQLRNIEAEYVECENVEITKQEMISIIINKARVKHQAVIMSKLARECGGTLDHLAALLHQHWRLLYGDKATKGKESAEDDNNDEVALFTGTCHNCKEKGHKAAECKAERKGFKGKCNNC